MTALVDNAADIIGHWGAHGHACLHGGSHAAAFLDPYIVLQCLALGLRLFQESLDVSQVLFQLADECLRALRAGLVETSRIGHSRVVSGLMIRLKLLLDTFKLSFCVLGHYFKVTGRTFRIASTHLGLDRPLFERRESFIALLERTSQVLDLRTSVGKSHLQGLDLAIAVLPLRNARIELLLFGIQIGTQVADLVHRRCKLSVHDI